MNLEFKKLKHPYTVHIAHPKYEPFDFNFLNCKWSKLKENWDRYVSKFKTSASELTVYQLLALNTLSVFETINFKLLPQWSFFIVKISGELKVGSNFDAIYKRMYFNEYDDFLCMPNAYTYALHETRLLKGMFYPKISESKTNELFSRLSPAIQFNTFYNIKAASIMFDGLEENFNLVRTIEKIKALVNPSFVYIALEGKFEPERVARMYSNYTDAILNSGLDFDTASFMAVVARGLIYKLSDETGAYTLEQKQETQDLVNLIDSKLTNTRINELDLLYNMNSRESIRDALLSLRYEDLANITSEQLPFIIS